MGTITWDSDVDYQTRGQAVPPLQSSGDSILWRTNIGSSWNSTVDGHARLTVNQITFPAGTTITEVGQEIDVVLTVNNYTTTMKIRYTGHFDPYSMVPNHGELFAFEVVSVSQVTGAPDLGPLIGQTVGFMTGDGALGASSVVSKEIIADVPDLSITCFLAGARVRMFDGGIKNIEDIQVGDMIYSYRPDGTEGSNQVTAVLCRRVVVTNSDSMPVVVRKSAFGEGMPDQDISMTGDHCLWLDGYFVPVRMLVNDRSIFVDTTKSSYDVFHIETDSHSIINVDNILTETFLRTTRGVSTNTEIVKIKGPKSWNKDSASPLRTETAFVEPIFNKFLSRAKSLEIDIVNGSRKMEQDSNLHLATEDGRIIRPLRRKARRFIFLLPSHATTVWLCSRTSRPSETTGPYVDDRRELGVLVGCIDVFNAFEANAYKLHIETSNLPGWFAVENMRCRWTKGKAMLNFPPASDGQIVSIEIVGGGPYPVEENARDVKLQRYKH